MCDLWLRIKHALSPRIRSSATGRWAKNQSRSLPSDIYFFLAAGNHFAIHGYREKRSFSLFVSNWGWWLFCYFRSAQSERLLFELLTTTQNNNSYVEAERVVIHQYKKIHQHEFPEPHAKCSRNSLIHPTIFPISLSLSLFLRHCFSVHRNNFRLHRSISIEKWIVHIGDRTPSNSGQSIRL